MNSYEIYFYDDFEVAEMIYNFCNQDKYKEEFFSRDGEDLSIAEFVYFYHFKEFQVFCLRYYNVFVKPCKDDLV